MFKYPVDPGVTFLKRVVPVGGDMVEMRDGVLLVTARR